MGISSLTGTRTRVAAAASALAAATAAFAAGAPAAAQATPPPVPVQGTIESVATISASNIWAVGLRAGRVRLADPGPLERQHLDPDQQPSRAR